MTECIFLQLLESPEILCPLSSPVREDTGTGLKCLVRQMVK